MTYSFPLSNNQCNKNAKKKMLCTCTSKIAENVLLDNFVNLFSGGRPMINGFPTLNPKFI